MAQRIITQLVDDLDGTELAAGKGETLIFSFEGSSYEIDLSSANAKAMRKAIEPYLSAARKLPADRRRTPSPARGRSNAASSDYDPKAVRAWAVDAGIDIPARGRIPAGIVEQYRSRA